MHDYGGDSTPDVPFLVMEFVDGPSLAAVLAGGPLEPEQVMDLIAQIAAGLHAAHSAGLVHRDIKPANLLITRDGQVKITDFGIASVTGGAPLTSTEVLVGTPAYLAPERAAGGPATPASDLYSLGVVGYECLTGAPPFRGSALEVAERARQLRTGKTSLSGAVLPAAASGGSSAAPFLTLAETGAETTQASQLALDERRVARHPRPAWKKIGAGLAAAAALTIAGLGGWQAGLAGSARPHSTASPRRSAPPPMVLVSGATLTGRRVGFVTADLRRLGVLPRLAWVPTSVRPPGTVLPIQPGGALPPATVITVTVAAQPSHQNYQAGGDAGGGGNDGGGDGGGNNGGGDGGGNGG